MHQGQFGGPIGPFVDPATQQHVNGKLWGTVTFTTQGDPGQATQWLQSAVMNAAKQVIEQKLSTNQVALQTLPGSLPYYSAEIIQACSQQAAQVGAQITQLELQAQLDMPAMPQPMGQMPPPPPTAAQAIGGAFAQEAKERLDPSNYEVKARFNIGGLKIDASSSEGINTDKLGQQLKDKAKSNLIWYGAGCVIVGIVLIGLAGLGWYIYSQASDSTSGTKAATGPAETVSWDGKSMYNCGGSKHVKIEGVTADISSGMAINAGGGCHVELVNVNITAPIALSAGANAVITVTGGSITGKQFAAKALGNAKITFSGTKVTGKTQALGAGAKITGP